MDEEEGVRLAEVRVPCSTCKTKLVKVQVEVETIDPNLGKPRGLHKRCPLCRIIYAYDGIRRHGHGIVGRGVVKCKVEVIRANIYNTQIISYDKLSAEALNPFNQTKVGKCVYDRMMEDDDVSIW